MSQFSSRSISRRNSPKSGGKLFLGIIVLVVLGGLYSVWSVGNTDIIAKKYNIEKGYTVSVLAEKLGFDVAPWRYRLWLKFFGPKTTNIPVGTYQAATGTTIQTFLTDTVTNPIHNDLTITVLPGWSMYDMDAALAAKSLIAPGDILQTARVNFKKYQEEFSFLQGVASLEGFLYPDTYRLRQNATADDIIRVTLREFDKKIGADYRSLDQKKAYQTLILASIVEREEGVDANQPIVAGILSKRVAERIPMGADATVCYGYAKTQKQCTPAFIGTVIHEKNLYNTRNQQGYPPTPIANFSLVTWQAARNPEVSSYYYYLHDSTGNIHYAKTNEEHNINKQKYIQ